MNDAADAHAGTNAGRLSRTVTISNREPIANAGGWPQEDAKTDYEYEFRFTV